MEHAPFSTQGLAPEQLEKEAALVEKSIYSVQESLKEIDLKAIDEILLDLFKRVYPHHSEEDLKSFFRFDGNYAIKVKYTEFLDRGNYSTEALEDTSSAYAQGENITILAREFVDDRGELLPHSRSGLVKTLIHEMMHSKSFRNSERFPATGINLDYLDTGNGSAFSHLNEGLTELIADAVYSEYLARQGTAASYDAMIDGKKMPIQRHAVYINERLALDKLVNMITQYTEVPKDKVYQSLVAEYFTNGDLRRSEIIEEIDSDQLKQFLEKIEINDSHILKSFSPQEIQTYANYLHWAENGHVQALVGRDYIAHSNVQRYEKDLAMQPLHKKVWEFIKYNF